MTHTHTQVYGKIHKGSVKPFSSAEFVHDKQELKTDAHRTDFLCSCHEFSQSGINDQQNNVCINVLTTLLAVLGVWIEGRHHDNE